MYAVIEDDLLDYDIICKTILKGKSHRYFCCIKDFLDSDEKFEAVLSDLNLPDMIGVGAIKAAKEKCDIVYVLTGMGGDFLSGSAIKNLIDAGAKEVFIKGKVFNKDYTSYIRGQILK